MNRNFLYFLYLSVFLGYSFIYTFGNETPLIEKLETKPGRPVKMKCPKTVKTERLVWFYRKDNKSKEGRVEKRNHVQIQSNEQDDILILNKPTYSDKGFYVLRQVGQGNYALCQKYLEILSVPSALCSSPPMPVDTGEDVTLTCTAERGHPKPLPTWYRIDALSGNRIELVNTSKLIIKDITRYAANEYQCTLRNSEGEDNCSITVTVHFKPEIEVYESIIELRDDKNATLMCRVTANPMSVVVWTKDDKAEQLYSNHLYDIKVDDELLKTHYTRYVILTLKAKTLRKKMFGVYWCRITGYGVEYAQKVKVLRIADND